MATEPAVGKRCCDMQAQACNMSNNQARPHEVTEERGSKSCRLTSCYDIHDVNVCRPRKQVVKPPLVMREKTKTACLKETTVTSTDCTISVLWRRHLKFIQRLEASPQNTARGSSEINKDSSTDPSCRTAF